MKLLLWVIVFVLLIAVVWLAVCACHGSGGAGAYFGGAADDDYSVDATMGGGRGPRMALRDPGYSLMREGKRHVEARLRKGPFGDDAHTPIKVGDVVTVARSREEGDTFEYPHARRFEAEVKALVKYDTFEELIKKEGLEKIATGATDAKEAAKAYKSFDRDDEEKTLGVVAIKFGPPRESAARPAGDGAPRGAKKAPKHGAGCGCGDEDDE